LKITYLELPVKNLIAQKEFYAEVLQLPVTSTSAVELKIHAGATELVFTKADESFDGAYHFAFNIPENKFDESKHWISSRIPLLKDTDGRDEFASDRWKSHSLYFKDAAGNVLEFIARHNLKNPVTDPFGGDQILDVSEIGLPSEKVIEFAKDLCMQLDIAVFKQEPNGTFTPIGDDDGLFILPVKDRIWKPNSGVPAKLLPVKVRVEVNEKKWGLRGYPYEVFTE